MADFIAVLFFRIVMLSMALISLTSFLGIELTSSQALYLGIFCAAISAFVSIERGDKDD